MIDTPKGSILVIEDDPGISLLLERYLRPFASVTVKASMAEALEEIQRKDINPADVITLDVNLLDTRGHGTLSQIKTIREHNPNAFIIVLTGILGQEDRQTALDAGADEFILKDPLIMSEAATFLRKLRDVLVGLFRQPVRYQRNTAVLEAFAERIRQAACDKCDHHETPHHP